MRSPARRSPVHRTARCGFSDAWPIVAVVNRRYHQLRPPRRPSSGGSECYGDLTPTGGVYNPAVVKPANEKPALRPVQGFALLRERGSDADWFAVEFLVYYERSQIRTFA